MPRWLSCWMAVSCLVITAKSQVPVPDMAFRNILKENGIECIDQYGILDTLCASRLEYNNLDIRDLVVENYDGLQYFKNLKFLNIFYMGSKPRVAAATDIRKFAPDKLEEVNLLAYNSFKIPFTMFPYSCKTLNIITSPFSQPSTLEVSEVPEGMETISIINQPFPIHGHYTNWYFRITKALPSTIKTMYLENIRLEVDNAIAPPGGLRNLVLVGGGLSGWCGNSQLYEQLESLSLTGSFFEPLLAGCPFSFGGNLRDIKLNDLDGSVLIPSLKDAFPKLGHLKSLSISNIYNTILDFNHLLPKNLNSLEIENSLFPTAFNLPEGLKHLSLVNTNTKKLGQIQYPENLETLNLAFVEYPEMNNLPGNLKSLWLYSVAHNIDWNKQVFPSQLETLGLVNIKIGQIDTLAASVRTLMLQNNYLTRIRHLPGTLVQLEVHNQPDLTNIEADLTALPLSTLKLIGLGLTIMPDLPATLDSLFVMYQPNLRCVKPLPENLRFLNWEFPCIPNETRYLKDGFPYPLCEEPSHYLCPEIDPEIRGRLFLDLNENLIYDEGDRPMAYRSFLIEPIKKYVTTKADGTFDCTVPFGGYYWINFYGNDQWRSYSLFNIFNFSSFSSGFSGDSISIPFAPVINIRDMEVFASSNAAIPDGDVIVDVVVSDRGNPAVDKADLTLGIPDFWEVKDVWPPPTSAGARQLEWKQINPGPLAQKVFKVRFHVPNKLKEGTSYQITAKLETEVDDYPDNNQFAINGLIISRPSSLHKSVDKIFIEQHNFLENEILYTLAYYNLTSDTIRNLILTDSLSNYFFKERNRVIHSTHECQLKMTESGVMQFEFKDIAIPPYNEDPINGSCRISFSVYLDTYTPYGTEVVNAFHALEDSNSHYSSNRVITRIGLRTSVENQGLHPVRMYPNPASETFKVEWKQGSSFHLQIIDLQGKVHASTWVEGDGAEISIRHLPSGMYLVQVSNQSGSTTGKLIVR